MVPHQMLRYLMMRDALGSQSRHGFLHDYCLCKMKKSCGEIAAVVPETGLRDLFQDIG
jgi:hypothetical protein